MDILDEESTEPKIAPLSKRIAAFFINIVVLLALIFLVASFFDRVHIDPDNGLSVDLQGTSALVYLAVWFITFPIAEGLTGQTIGKKLVKIKVIGKKTGTSNILQSVIRHILYPVDLFFLVGLLVAVNNPNKQRIGDLAANTLVVEK